MRKILIFMLLFTVAFNVLPLAYASKNGGEKCLRGLANIATFYLEVPRQIYEESKASGNPVMGTFAGIPKGAVCSIFRFFSGVWDVISSPIPVPKDYEPLWEPDFVFGVE